MRLKLILPVFLSVFFLGMGALQLNDPDPLYWVTVYAMTALIPHRHLLQRHYAIIFWTTAGMVFAGLLQSFSGFIDFVSAGDWGLLTAPMTDKLPAIEYAREFLGLLFSVACLFGYRKSRVSD
ncbi:MAG: transmembrane 220 family protein [Halieaceae bacterium]